MEPFTLFLYVALQGQAFAESVPVVIHQFKKDVDCATFAMHVVQQNPDIVIKAVCVNSKNELTFDSTLQ